jgi:hypothetical protein
MHLSFRASYAVCEDVSAGPLLVFLSVALIRS